LIEIYTISKDWGRESYNRKEMVSEQGLNRDSMGVSFVLINRKAL